MTHNRQVGPKPPDETLALKEAYESITNRWSNLTENERRTLLLNTMVDHASDTLETKLAIAGCTRDEYRRICDDEFVNDLNAMVNREIIATSAPGAAVALGEAARDGDVGAMKTVLTAAGTIKAQPENQVNIALANMSDDQLVARLERMRMELLPSPDGTIDVSEGA